MRLRTFTAADMPSAMRQVREALGEEAIILSSAEMKGRKGVTVTAAVDMAEESSSSTASHAVGDLVPSNKIPASANGLARMTATNVETNYLLFELQNMLRFHNLPEHFIAKILQKLPRGKLAPEAALEKTVGAYFQFAPLPLEVKGTHVMLVGPHGAGKTLAIAKMAAQLGMDKQPVTVVTTDNKRAGGVEQLQAFTDILDMPLKIAASRKELLAHLQSFPKTMRVLIDTAGCNPYDPGELRELEALAEGGHAEPVLTLPAGGDSQEAIDIAEAFGALPIKRLLVTRADAAKRLGGALAAAAAHQLAFCHLGRSARIIDRLEPLDGELLAQLLLHNSRLQSPLT